MPPEATRSLFEICKPWAAVWLPMAAWIPKSWPPGSPRAFPGYFGTGLPGSFVFAVRPFLFRRYAEKNGVYEQRFARPFAE